MKKMILCAAVVCLLLAGCGNVADTKPTTDAHDHDHANTQPSFSRPPVTTAPPTTAPLGPAEFLLYLPNETGDGFVTQSSTMNNLDHDGILLLLMVNGAINEGVAANSCKREGTQLHLDMNQAFLDQLISAGADGERMVLGSVVNTFLSAYNCETVLLTVGGETINTGNNTYDSPFTLFE